MLHDFHPEARIEYLNFPNHPTDRDNIYNVFLGAIYIYIYIYMYIYIT